MNDLPALVQHRVNQITDREDDTIGWRVRSGDRRDGLSHRVLTIHLRNLGMAMADVSSPT